MKALVVGNGRVPPRAALPASIFGDVDLVVAADGGAGHAIALGLHPDVLVGDVDSAHPDAIRLLEARRTRVIRVRAEKDESDLELALLHALAHGATTILVLGALGGPRVEHELANIGLLALAGTGRDVAIVDERSAIRLMDAGSAGDAHAAAASLEIRGEPGDFVSLQPWGGDAVGVTTAGLRYPLRDEDLQMGPSRGLSNELTGTVGQVACRHGRLLVVHTRRAALVEGPRDDDAADLGAAATEVMLDG